jgi:hypothetical protein
LNWLPRSSGSKGFGSGDPRNRGLRFLSKYQNLYLTGRRNGLAICAADRFGGPAERLFVIYKEEVDGTDGRRASDAWCLLPSPLKATHDPRCMRSP